MDITFNCGSCGQHIVVDEAGAGQQAECPKCGQSCLIPASVGKTSSGSVDQLRRMEAPLFSPPLTGVPARPNAPILESYKWSKPTPSTDISPRRIDALSGVVQLIAWLVCFGVLAIGGLLFFEALAGATGAPQEAAAGAVFATVFIGAYVFARIVEKVCNLFDRK